MIDSLSQSNLIKAGLRDFSFQNPSSFPSDSLPDPIGILKYGDIVSFLSHRAGFLILDKGYIDLENWEVFDYPVAFRYLGRNLATPRDRILYHYPNGTIFSFSDDSKLGLIIRGNRMINSVLVLDPDPKLMPIYEFWETVEIGYRDVAFKTIVDCKVIHRDFDRPLAIGIRSLFSDGGYITVYEEKPDSRGASFGWLSYGRYHW